MSEPPLLAALILGIFIDALIGDPPLLWRHISHPVVLFGKMISFLEGRLNHGRARKAKGFLTLLILVSLAWLFGAMISHLPLAFLWEVLIIAILLAHKSLAAHVRAVHDALFRDLEAAKTAVSKIVGRDTAHMSESDVVSAAIESAAENFSDGFIAPVFWAAVAGFPGILIYKIVNTADSMIGYRNARFSEFGFFAARCDDALNIIPARIAALIILAANRGLGFWGKIRREATQHRSPNAGWPEAAFAYVLNIALSGPRLYEGVWTKDPTLNSEGRNELRQKDILDALGVLWRSWGGMNALLLLILLFTAIWL